MPVDWSRVYHETCGRIPLAEAWRCGHEHHDQRLGCYRHHRNQYHLPAVLAVESEDVVVETRTQALTLPLLTLSPLKWTMPSTGPPLCETDDSHHAGSRPLRGWE